MKTRPRFIHVEFTDPFDGALCSSCCYPYVPRMLARGILSRHLRRLKNALRSIQSNILEGRTPDMKITFK